jgi:hypothetical protein
MKLHGVKFYSKFRFHVLLDYIISQSVGIMSLILTITYSSPTIDRLLVFYLNLVRPKFEYASTVWTSVISTDAKMLETIQQKLIALCQ